MASEDTQLLKTASAGSFLLIVRTGRIFTAHVTHSIIKV
jgi:hypothetical protein